VHAGFYPVLASSGGQSGRPRLDSILTALNGCRYSIHDLSRCRGEGDENLARFNMPLELGMAMAIHGGNLRKEGHEYLVLVPAQLARAGFEREGILPRYREKNGRREDRLALFIDKR
jgi:hypothetical protein